MVFLRSFSIALMAVLHFIHEMEANASSPHKLDQKQGTLSFDCSFAPLRFSCLNILLNHRGPDNGILFVILVVFTQQNKSLNAVVQNLLKTYFATYGYSFPLTGKAIYLKFKTRIICF